MQNYPLGTILLLSFPFSNTGSKRRPVLVLLDSGDSDVVVARVTSQVQQTAYDVVVDAWQQAGLMLPPTIRLHKIATLEKRLIDRSLGQLADPDLERVRATIQQLWTSI